MTRMNAWMVGKSRLNRPSARNRPTPENANTVSVSTAPEMSRPSCRPMTVVTGSRAFRSTCRRVIVRLSRPLASAVRT